MYSKSEVDGKTISRAFKPAQPFRPATQRPPDDFHQAVYLPSGNPEDARRLREEYGDHKVVGSLDAFDASMERTLIETGMSSWFTVGQPKGKAFDRWLPRCFTTIHMPAVLNNLGEPVDLAQENLVVPFPITRFIEPYAYPWSEVRATAERDAANFKWKATPEQLRERHMAQFGSDTLTGCEEIIVTDHFHEDLLNATFALLDDKSNRLKVGSCSKVTWMHGNGSVLRTMYGPEDENCRLMQYAITLQRFNMWTRSREVRFTEKKIIRQERRANGWSPEYREFVIMKRGEVTRQAWSESDHIRHLIPTLRAMHGVRAHWRQEHLRRLRNGEVMVVPAGPVAAHVRGRRGSAVQVKDYRLTQ